MISIILPVYNVLPFLDKCVESVISQSYRDLEIILVDDGSTDGSGERCDYYAKQDDRIKVIHKPNGGLSDARNAGIAIAQGEYITFIDSDDYILPDYIEYLYNRITRDNADMAVCQVTFVDEHDQELSVGGVSVDKVVNGNENCMKAFLTDTAIDTPAWRKLYRTSMFSTGIHYPVGRYHEDVFTTYKLIALCETISVGSRPLYAYRQRPGSIVNSTFSPKHLDAITGNIERYTFISSRFPRLEPMAVKGILHAANICSMRIAKSKTDAQPYLSTLQPLYRKFLKSYLKSNCRTASKIFATAAWINLSLLIKIISRFTK